MSYELDNLKREVDSLKWQKAENYKLESLQTSVYHLQEKINHLQYQNSYLEERISKLEQKELERERENE
jgi:predicted nuclease with TOPRIM domain